MGKALTFIIALTVIAGIFCAGSGYADSAPPQNIQTGFSNDPTTGTSVIPPVCNAQTSPPAFIRPLVTCLAGVAFNANGTLDTSGNLNAYNVSTGVIPIVTINMLNNLKQYFLPVVQALFVLMVTIFGFRLTTGGIKNPKEETFKLAFKIVGIMVFMTSAPLIYTSLISIMQELGDDISRASVSINQTGFCNTNSTGNANAYSWTTTSSSTGSNLLWDRWDCIFRYMFGMAAPATLATAGLGAFLFAMLVGSAAGIAVFFLGLYLISAMFYTLVRCVHVYLMAVLGLSLMICVGYLFVPLLIFEAAFPKGFFQRWRSLVFGYILTPVILLGYMGMMLVALDIALFSGTFSIKNSIDPQGLSASYNNDAFAYATQYYPLQDNFKNVLYMDMTNVMPVASAVNTSTTPNQLSRIAGGGTVGNMNSLVKPDPNNPGQLMDATSSDYTNTPDPNQPPMPNASNAANIGLDFKKLDLASLAGGVEKVGDYLLNIVIAFGVAAALMYIMYSLIGYVEVLAGTLASEGTGAGPQIAGSEALGESQVRSTLEAGQFALQAAAIFYSGGTAAVAEGAGAAAAEGAAGAAEGAAAGGEAAATSGAEAATSGAGGQAAAGGASNAASQSASATVQRAVINAARDYATQQAAGAVSDALSDKDSSGDEEDNKQ